MWMVAAIVCAALMVSCGGEKKADEKKAAADTVVAKVQEVVVADPVVAKAQEMVAKMKDATSESEAMAVVAPYESYYNSLSKADQAKFDEAVDAALKAAEAAAATEVAATSGATAVEEPVKAEVSPAIKAKATELANKMVAAIKSGDMEKAEKLSEEADAWFEKLSEAEQMQASQIAASIMSSAGLE